MTQSTGPTDGLLITATDTGVGKTYLTEAIARSWCRQGRSFRVCKPVATGARWSDGRWESDDASRLAEAAGEPDPSAVTPWVFAAAACPPVAARADGREILFSEYLAAVRDRWGGEKAILLEGVGGLLCPLTEEATVADLAEALGLPLVVVARRSLGTLNHTLLTVEVIRRRGLELAGVVLSETTPMSGLAERTNPEELRRRGVPVLAVLPYRPPGAGRGAEDGLAEVEAVDWWSLARVSRLRKRGGRVEADVDRGIE